MHTSWIIAGIIVLAVIVIGLWWYSQQRRRGQLRDQFGPEYDRAVRERGGEGAAAKELERRQQRVNALDIKPLDPQVRNRFSQEWRTVQAHFVDDPQTAVAEADRLVGEVMQTRGYPVGDFEQRAADISVDHPQVVENYRSAHDIAQRDGQATTEDLRKAMVHYRGLFEDLLGDASAAPAQGRVSADARTADVMAAERTQVEPPADARTADVSAADRTQVEPPADDR